MDRPAPGTLGLIAGQGRLPLAVARSARRRGRAVAAIGFPGQTDPDLEGEGARVTWLEPGQVGDAVAALRAAGVREAVMAGKVPKAGLLTGRRYTPDAEASRLLADLGDRRDDSILDAIARFLEEHGIVLLPQVDWVPEWVAPAGVLGKVAPQPSQRADAAFGFPIAKAIAGLDVGQTVVVKERAVLAVEAIEGTDETIRRAGAIGGGACVVKVSKPHQDPRFDVPAVGPATIGAMVEAGATTLAVEAGCTLLLEREALVAAADAGQIALLGIEPEAPGATK